MYLPLPLNLKARGLAVQRGGMHQATFAPLMRLTEPQSLNVELRNPEAHAWTGTVEDIVTDTTGIM